MFVCNLEVLVNGCSTQDISIQRGLKEGYHLSPFLFLLVAEGLSGMIYRVVELNLLFGIRVGSFYLVASHLQYADDTNILIDATIDNL